MSTADTDVGNTESVPSEHIDLDVNEKLYPDELNRDSFDDDVDSLPPTERWAPLGASNPSPAPRSPDGSCIGELTVDELRDEQERLNQALTLLTSHFAQVQFRLKQICNSEPSEREELLGQLTDFAAKGCPDIFSMKPEKTKPTRLSSQSDHTELATAEQQAQLEKQRLVQLELISRLKEILRDVELYAFESGESAMVPTLDVMEKQRLVIERLKSQMDLRLEGMELFSEDQLKSQVDQALKKLINPMKVKDSVVEQLKTQINDLHRFIEFLQGSNTAVQCTCLQEGDGTGGSVCLVHHSHLSQLRAGASKSFGNVYEKEKHAATIMSYTAELLNHYILAQLGCQSQQFRKNELKKTSKGNHYGDLRATLELAIDKVSERAEFEAENDFIQARKLTRSKFSYDSDVDDDEDEYEDVLRNCSDEMIHLIRKSFCPALRNLLQHGMIQPGMLSSSKTVAFGCIPNRAVGQTAASGDQEPATHIWDVIMKYYNMKHGREFNDAPVRKLSQSFNLDSIGGRAITSKQMLLSAIDNILSTHGKLKRSPDSHFKAFVSAALNQRKLVGWLRMIFRTREIVEENYFDWSYVKRSGVEEGFKALEKLYAYNFHLPVDLAVKPFQNIKDAF